MPNLDDRRREEIEYWSRVRAEQGSRPIDVDSMRHNDLQPCYAGNGDVYSENRMAFYDLIRQRGGWAGKYILDYGCGNGEWALFYGLTGARRVVGFDMNPVGIENGRRRASQHGVADRVRFDVMDATRLAYPNDEFEIVIGKAILHHTIKYDGIFEQLHRVMRPGAAAYFLENLADFPIWRLWWTLKGEVPEGDVPIFSREVQEKSRMFSSIEIIGDTLVHAIKSFLYKPGMSSWRRATLRTTHRIDNALFRVCPPLRRWGSFSYIVLHK